MNVALFDYGAGNLHSLGKALEAYGARVTATPLWEEVLAMDALVLPGVGAFSAAVRALAGEQERIRDALLGGLPSLGICLGMQLFFDASEEGEGEGIGLVPGRVRLLKTRVVPQMGWNQVRLSRDPLFDGLEELVAYYANSFICEPRDPGAAIASTRYQGEDFAAGVHVANSWGVQFHPEKSSAPGLHIIRNFLDQVRELGGGS